VHAAKYIVYNRGQGHEDSEVSCSLNCEQDPYDNFPDDEGLVSLVEVKLCLTGELELEEDDTEDEHVKQALL
jgi:hypothetical protein